MRLLLIVDVFTPARTSAAVQMRDLARTLIREHHECMIVTPDDSIQQRFRLEHQDDVPVLRIRARPIKRINLIRRAINELLLSRSMWQGYRRSPLIEKKWDGIVFYSPTIFFGRFVSRLKKAHDCSAYLILRDVFPDWAADLGLMRRGIHYWFFKACAMYQYSVADAIGIESAANRRYFASRDTRVEVLENWIDMEAPTHPAPLPEPIPRGKVLVYAGNIGVAQDMDNLLRLARSLLHKKDWQFLFVGDGTDRRRVEAEIARRGLSNVVLMAEIDPDRLRGLLRKCHVGLISLDRRLRSHNVPGKLLCYLEAGLPVIASLNPGNELRRFIERSDIGKAVWNGEDDAFADAARELLENESERAAASISARRVCREVFSSSRAARTIVDGLQGLNRDAAVVSPRSLM